MIYYVFVYLIVTVLRYELPWWGGVWSPTAVDIVTSTEVMCLCALIKILLKIPGSRFRPGRLPKLTMLKSLVRVQSP